MVERLIKGRRFYPESTVTLILEGISSGVPVASICGNPAFPCEKTFYAWLAADAGLRGRVDAARAAARRKNPTHGANHG